MIDKKKIEEKNPFSFWSQSLIGLVEKLEEIGEEEFRNIYPHPILILIGGPETESDDWSDPKTAENNDNGDDINEKRSFGKHVSFVEKTDRNPFGSWVTVGRAGNNDIIIRSSKISKLHAAFIIGREYKIIDKGSANGTMINGTKIESGKEVQINSGDRIRFWRYEFQFFMPEEFFQLLLRHARFHRKA